MKNLIFFSIVFSVFLFSCNKESSYTLTVINPESYSIKVGSNSFTGSVIGPNSSEVYSSSASSDNSISIVSSYDSDGKGDYLTQYAPTLEFNIEDGGDYNHVLGSGVVTEN